MTKKFNVEMGEKKLRWDEITYLWRGPIGLFLQALTKLQEIWKEWDGFWEVFRSEMSLATKSTAYTFLIM